MKTFKAICAALILALSLSIPTYADDTKPGEIHTPGSPCLITGGSDNKESSPGTCNAGDTADSSLSVLADLVWAVASIF